MFAIAGALVACNDNASNSDAAGDSARIADSIRREDSIRALTPVMPDTTTTVIVPDTLKVDTTVKK